jgi:hypothetical protein
VRNGILTLAAQFLGWEEPEPADQPKPPEPKRKTLGEANAVALVWLVTVAIYMFFVAHRLDEKKWDLRCRANIASPSRNLL